MVTYTVVQTQSLDALQVFHALRLIRSGSRTALGAIASQSSLQEFYDYFVHRSTYIALAFDNNRIVGTASLKFLGTPSSRALFRRSSLFYVWLLQNCPNVIELGYVVVAPDYSNQHIATTLCEKLLELFPWKEVYATVHTTNSPSLRFVDNLGFFPVGASYVSRFTGIPVQCYKHNPLDFHT
jgi:RimJ/RimL family protein N-acetyltransferase